MVIIKWIKKFFSKDIFNILKGNYYRLFNKHEWLYLSRYKQCKKCAYKVQIKGIGEICYICGCPLKSKLRVPNEHCDINMW